MLYIYNICKQLNYNIIIKTRKQDKIFDNELKDKYYFEEGEYYPNVSLELLTISNIAIIFSSSALEECIYMNVPVIDINIDNRNRLSFLKIDTVYKKINLENLNLLKENIKKLEIIDKSIFSEIKKIFKFQLFR